MGVTQTENQEDAEEPRASGTPQPDTRSEQATTQLLIGAAGDRCTNCGSPLASDQRYCVQCGERRGRSRFGSALAGQPPQPPSAAERAAAPAEPPRRRGSYGATLVAGIATLILAMGVGVEIGRIANSNNSSSARQSAPAVTVQEGGTGNGASVGTGTSAGAASTQGGTGSSSSHAKHGKAAHHVAQSPKNEAKRAQQAAAAPKPTKAAVQKASSASSSVLGGNGGQPNSTVTTGQSCQSGTAGCQNGHFSGNFFGG